MTMTSELIQTNGRSIALPNGAYFTSTQLVLPNGLDVEQWEEVGRPVRDMGRMAELLLADWLAYGKEHFGQKVARESADQLHIDFKQADELSAISPQRRRLELSVQHHWLVAKTYPDSPAKQQKALELAIKESLTPKELRLSMEAGRVVRSEPGQRSNLVTIEGIMSDFRLWAKDIDASQYSENARAAVKKLLQPVIEFYARL